MKPPLAHSAAAIIAGTAIISEVNQPIAGSPPDRPRASQRLPAATVDGLREFSEFGHIFAKRGHAAVWAIGYEVRHGKLPSARQVVLGVQSDLEIRISRMSACRALSLIRQARPD